jgi:hypothetical protein
MSRISLLLVPAALLAVTTAARAGDPIPIGTDNCDHTFARAGNPEMIRKCAVPSNTCNYTGYYVGGGCAFHGSPPGPLEGTWGWDYVGPSWLPHRVILAWCGRCQGGTGAYKTDGPHVPDPFALKLHTHESHDP